MRKAAFLFPVVSLALFAAVPASAGNLPTLPGATEGGPSDAPAAPTGGAEPEAAGAAGNAAPTAVDRVRRGVVLIERDGRFLGFGTVLGGDGRILTSLSVVGQSEVADIRYSDGALVHAKVGHRDPTWDLALLVPHTVHWKDGLIASELAPGESDLRAPMPPRAGAKPIALPVHFKGLTDAVSRQGDSLADALDVEVHNALPLAGVPILDDRASVVGVLVRACKLAITSGGQDAFRSGPISCAPTIIGAPVSALRSFLSRTPADAVPPAPWLGIVGEADATGPVHGVRVMAVAPESPAQKAGLKGGSQATGKAGQAPEGADRIIAVDSIPVDTPQKLADAIGKRAIGEQVKLLLLGGAGSFREVSVVLRAAP